MTRPRQWGGGGGGVGGQRRRRRRGRGDGEGEGVGGPGNYRVDGGRESGGGEEVQPSLV